ncbi:MULTISPECIES: C39 family peptidase [Niallia]|jgi:hypothetical protein|uniref:Peptidase C39-like domain-containing protein n=1 Tax=Niallia circulans TaxID=1397 RepID=A0A0J1HSF2_NIACI|nr:C39 family peptidase [Niallia circulans]KLV16606.1 hypothetical protein ABW02_25225 [Niallia circulans]MED5103534.1 C39 family peptidase [Niallia circulans]
MNKKLIKLVLVTIISTALIIPISVFAETETKANDDISTGAALNDPNYIQNEEYYNSLEEKRDKQTEREEQAFQKKQAMSKVAAKTNEHYTISVKYNKQQYSNFCGVAAGRQSLSFHKLKSGSSDKLPSQKHFGNTIGTLPNGGGTKSTFLADGLNKYKYVYKFSGNPYIVGNIAKYSKPAVKLETRVKTTLRNKKTAPILLTRTDFIEQYRGTKYRHYVTVSGYDKNADEFRLVDPNHHTEFTKGGTYWSKLKTTVSKKGVARAVYEADKETKGSNPVMVW